MEIRANDETAISLPTAVFVIRLRLVLLMLFNGFPHAFLHMENRH